ncbi:hypothetical protein DM01DRAFT_1399181, partial [Hesseltinella vesiculosa]
LANIRSQLVEISKEAHCLSHESYTADDVLRLQRRLSNVDQQFYDQKMDTRYEDNGVTQVVKELDQVHHNIHSMLSRVADSPVPGSPVLN